MKKLLLSFLLAISNIAFAHEGDLINTPFGNVLININLITIHSLNSDEEIPIGKDIMKVYVKDKFLNKTEDAIVLLFIEYTGRPECPAHYFIYEMSGSSEDKKTSVFGTCSDRALIKKEDNGATITMPKLGTETIVTYKYENGLIQELEPPKILEQKLKIVKK
jgi:hypothetical protein